MAGAQQHRTPTESNVNRPSSRDTASQDGRGPTAAAEVTPSDQVAVHRANGGTTDIPDVGVAADRALDYGSVKPSENMTGSTSDLYTNRVAIRMPMPTARVESGGGEGLQHDSTAQPELGPSLTVCIESISWLLSIFIDMHCSVLGNRTSIIQEGAGTAQRKNQRNLDSQSGT